MPNYRTLNEVIVDYFNQYPSDWHSALLRKDSRWQYGEPAVGSANDEDDFDFVERFTQLKAEFAAQLQDEAQLNTLIAQNWAKVQP